MKSLKKWANNLGYVLFSYVVAVLVAGALFAWFESKSIADGLWWSTMSSLTLVYDQIPKQTPTKIMAIIFTNFCQFMVVPLVIGHVVRGLLSDANVFSHHEQQWTINRLDEIAEKLGLHPPPEPEEDQVKPEDRQSA